MIRWTLGREATRSWTRPRQMSWLQGLSVRHRLNGLWRFRSSQQSALQVCISCLLLVDNLRLVWTSSKQSVELFWRARCGTAYLNLQYLYETSFASLLASHIGELPKLAFTFWLTCSPGFIVDPGGGADSVDEDEKVDFLTRSWAIVERKAESVYWSHYDTRCNKEKRIDAKKIPRRFA